MKLIRASGGLRVTTGSLRQTRSLDTLIARMAALLHAQKQHSDRKHASVANADCSLQSKGRIAEVRGDKFVLPPVRMTNVNKVLSPRSKQ